MAKFSAYPPLDSLVDLACRDGVDVRPTLLRVLTDLYVQKPAHSAEEETQYVELALGLIDSVDTPTRATVAATLSAYPAAPAAIVGRLADCPADSATDPAAEAGPTRQELADLFFAASAQERCLILTNLDVAAGMPARRPAPASSEVIRRLENAALQRNPGEFSRLLERALGIDRVLAERIARDHSGEPIVVAARALGMKAAVLQRILLFLNPVIGQSVARFFELAQLYDELTPAAAERMLSIWRQAGDRRQSGHEPALWNDERRSARSLATPERRRIVHSREPQPERYKTGGR